jgi:hypothetical protein
VTITKQKSIQAVLYTDTGTDLGFWFTGFNERIHSTFSIVIHDDSGYASVAMTVEQWNEIKNKVDSLIKEHIK